MTVQTEINFARKARDKGIAKAERHANQVHERWSDKAYEYLQTFLSMYSGEFLTEEFRAWTIGKMPQPPHGRAFGGVVQRAAKAGLIVKLGIAQVKNVKAHMANANVWKRA